MRGQVQLWREDFLCAVYHSPSIDKAFETVDRAIGQCHSGFFGIGTFNISIYEVAENGIIERCYRQLEPFRVPSGTLMKETA
jgi:hypothetical protein